MKSEKVGRGRGRDSRGEHWLRRLGDGVRVMIKEERLGPLWPSPHHHEHFRVLRGDDANELGHAHQTINPPH